MSTLTVYSGTADQYVRSIDAAWANARAGTGTLVNVDGAVLIAGTRFAGSYFVYQTFVGPFDTSSLGGSASISSVALSLNCNSAPGATISLSAVNYDWGASVTTGDFRDGTALGALTVMGSASIGVSASGYQTFSDSATFKAFINQTGDTRITVVADDDINNVTPTGEQYAAFDSADTGGSTTGPKLVITYSGGGGGGYVPFNPWPQLAPILGQ
jgi:hypothetical protein